ncbi:AraC family transcriptional regulator [Marinomonas sp. M1K-6]|uniref:AraC family transcriptional regulator n=1 Tax=Marinomonas profundi TaxID=2726122 RepID=A0A847RBZ4_9GAMM|nr:AraC family transcriptional regulator [Marinomonas profundi]NLQ18524.1 AraC family transcriptional regulator [Marinomonas profundi]UDV04397.1 AraC family transcriptional regulator [Marinomonas profundi]
MSTENRFQFAKSAVLDEVMLLEASMSDFSYGTHAHEEFSFGVTLSGRQDFFALGEHHKSHAGNVIVFNPDDAHDGHSGADDPLHYKMLYVHPDQLSPMLESAGVRRAQGFRIEHPVQNDAELKAHILRLATLVENDTSSALEYSSALFEFAEYLARQKGIQRSVSLVKSKRRTKDPVFERVRDYLHAHVGEDVSLDELSQVAHMSKYHLLRCFRDYFGMTPHQYWQNYRINRAKAALELGMPLADVAFTFGFTDLSYFNRRFKPMFGLTPYQFRRTLLRT